MSDVDWRLGQAPGQTSGPRLGIETLDRALGDLRHENLLFVLDTGVPVEVTADVLRAGATDVRIRPAEDRDSAVSAARDALLAGHVLVQVVAADDVHDDLQTLSSVIVMVSDGQMQIQKADGRPAAVLGASFAYSLEDTGMIVRRQSTAAVFGRGLRAVRLARGWKQADIARMAGVSVSAISQVERGRQSLSFETVVDLAAQLGLTVDALLHGRPSDYAVVRVTDRRSNTAVHPALHVEQTSLDIPARGSVAPGHFGHEGGLLHVISGPVVVTIGSERTVLRTGETLIAFQERVHDVRGVGPSAARVTWTTSSE